MASSIPKETFAQIRRLQIAAARKVTSLFSGAYRSAFKGRGIEFEGVREYRPGDDIHHINWFRTARMQHPFVKIFREERELTVMLVVDVSASGRFGSSKESKSQIIAEVGAILALSATTNHDKIGLLLFSDKAELYLKPKKNIRHVLRVIRELLYFTPENRGTDVKQALGFLQKVQPKGSICFVISDFITPGFEKELRLSAKRHEMICVEVYDEREESFPDLGLLHLKDAESGEIRLIDTSDPMIRQHFSKAAKVRRERLKQAIAGAGANRISLRTDESPTEALRKFFKTRERVR